MYYMMRFVILSVSTDRNVNQVSTGTDQHDFLRQDNDGNSLKRLIIAFGWSRVVNFVSRICLQILATIQISVDRPSYKKLLKTYEIDREKLLKFLIYFAQNRLLVKFIYSSSFGKYGAERKFTMHNLRK